MIRDSQKELKPHMQPNKGHMQAKTKKTHKKTSRRLTYNIEEIDRSKLKSLPRGSFLRS